MSAVDDPTLVARAKAGNREALGQLVKRHERAMIAIAKAYFASEADAEDAVQDAFVKAFRALDQLGDGDPFAPWMARITVNTCIDILRTRTDKLSLADFASTIQFSARLGQVQFTPATLARKNEEADLVRAAIGRLSEPHRVVLMLRYGEDMTYDQIAAYLGVPPSTVRGRLARAKGELDRALNVLQSSVGA